MAITLNSNSNYSQNITTVDGGVESVTVICYATVNTNRTLSFTFDIQNYLAYQNNLVAIKAEVASFMDYVKQQAVANGVDLL